MALAAAAQPADVEVVVTASRFEEPAEQAAASVSVITAEELVAAGEPTLVDALERLAGVSFHSTTGSPSEAEVSMRGFGESSFGRVLVLVDGRRVNRPDMAGPNWLQVPVENVERVEVVRGPATVLYGDHAVGGVINIITKKGTEKLTVTASALGGSFLFNQERLGVSGAAGPVRFALSGERTSSEGHRDRSAWSSLGGSANLDAELSDGAEASLRLGYNQTDYELPGGLTEADWEDDPSQAKNPEDEARDRSLNVDAGAKALIGESLEARVNASYAWNGIETDFVSLTSYTDVGIHTVTAAPRATFTRDFAATTLTITGGSDLGWEALEVERFDDLARTLQAADAELSKRSAGFYATANLAFHERLAIETGGRYELAEIAAKGSLGSTLDDSKTHTGVAGSASVVYRVPHLGRAWVRFDRVYRYPFLDEQVSYYNYFFLPDAFLEDLEAEKGWGVDTGAAAALGALELKANAYLLDMSDEIAFNGSENENLARTRHLGAACEAAWTAGPLLIAGSYSWQLTTFRAGIDEGNEVPLVPNHTAQARAEVRLPFDIVLSGSARYVSESFQGGDNANTADRTPDYVVIGASLTWRPGFVPGDLELFAGGENLLDAEYVSYVYFGGYYPAPGRTWRVGGFYRY